MRSEYIPVDIWTFSQSFLPIRLLPLTLLTPSVRRKYKRWIGKRAQQQYPRRYDAYTFFSALYIALCFCVHAKRFYSPTYINYTLKRNLSVYSQNSAFNLNINIKSSVSFENHKKSLKCFLIEIIQNKWDIIIKFVYIEDDPETRDMTSPPLMPLTLLLVNARKRGARVFVSRFGVATKCTACITMV